jgi:hypothetical protein
MSRTVLMVLAAKVKAKNSLSPDSMQSGAGSGILWAVMLMTP